MKRWTKEELLTIASLYKTKKAWKSACESSYRSARSKGLLNLCCSHMTPLWEKKWTPASILEKAKSFTTLIEFRKNALGAYSAATKLGLMDQVKKSLTHKPSISLDDIKADALKYKNRNEWKLKSPQTYTAAKNRKLLSELCKNMNKLGGISQSEKFILDEVRKIYPSAKSKYFGKAVRAGDYATRFQLDIYIQELNCGIEFNGTYHHSLAGLSRGRKNWPAEDLLNYHNIKKQFFKNIGIDYIEISEYSWTQDYKKCLNQINEYLKQKGKKYV